MTVRVLAAECAALAVVCGVLALLMMQPATPAPAHDAFRMLPDDLPVLSTPGQVYEARRYGRVGLYDGGSFVVVEGMPAEYVDYSAARVRLP